MTTGTAFLAGFVIASFTVFIVMSVFVFKPRYDQLMQQRDDWRERALAAEDTAQLIDPDIRILGDWGSAYDNENNNVDG